MEGGDFCASPKHCRMCAIETPYLVFNGHAPCRLVMKTGHKLNINLILISGQ